MNDNRAFILSRSKRWGSCKTKIAGSDAPLVPLGKSLIWGKRHFGTQTEVKG